MSEMPHHPKTIKMPVTHVDRDGHIIVPKTEASVQKPKPQKTRMQSLRNLAAAALFSVVGDSAQPTQPTHEAPASQTVDVTKMRTELGVNGPELVPNVDQRKIDMTAEGGAGVYARRQHRRQSVWETYAKPTNMDEVIERTEERDTRGDVTSIGAITHQDRLRTNVGEKINEQFLSHIRTRIQEECGRILVARELPKTEEEVGVTIDNAIDRSVRLAYMQAQQEGLKGGINLILADTEAMQLFSETIGAFVRAHPEQGQRDFSPLFSGLRDRVGDKVQQEARLPELHGRPLAETQMLEEHLAVDEFDVQGSRGASAHISFLEHNQQAITSLIKHRLSWFEGNVASIRHSERLKEATIIELSRALEGGGDRRIHDTQTRDRLFSLRTQLLR